MKIELTEQEINIILQTLNSISIPVRESPIVIDLINNIQKQMQNQLTSNQQINPT